MSQKLNYLEATAIMIRKGKFSAFPGMLSITQTEVVIEEKSKYLQMFGLIGLLFKNSFKSKFHYLTKEKLASVKKTSFGLNKEVLEFTLQDGNTFTLIVKPNLEAIVVALGKLNIQVQ